METNFVNKRAVKISLLNIKTLEHMNSLMCVPSKFIIWSIISVIMTMPKPALGSSQFWNADQRTHTELLVLSWKLLVLQNFHKPNHKVVNKIKELPNTRLNPNPKKNNFWLNDNNQTHCFSKLWSVSMCLYCRIWGADKIESQSPVVCLPCKAHIHLLLGKLEPWFTPGPIQALA